MLEGREGTRSQLQDAGVDVWQGRGQEWLYSEALRSIFGSQQVVVDAMRFREDHEIFRSRFGRRFLHVAVSAHRQLRMERYVTRGGSLAEFVSAEAHPVEAEISALGALAHMNIVNDNAMRDFEQQIDGLLRHGTQLWADEPPLLDR